MLSAAVVTGTLKVKTEDKIAWQEEVNLAEKWLLKQYIVENVIL